MSYPSKFVEFFGPSTWKTLHSIAFNYARVAEEPTELEKRDVIDFFRLMEKLLPCESCGVHYGKYINEHPVDASTRDALVRWLYEFHSAVNERTHKPQITFEEHKADYAGWNKQKMQAYTKLSASRKLKGMADPHLGRDVSVPSGKEGMMGEAGTAGTLAMVALAAVAGFAAYRVASSNSEKKKE
jgi:hypothetical protein